ncbi:MAG: hypothetical protein M3421_05355 [Bacteroidota bacterium]|nr:hypothetical protein [Bacteroidota bacterium]
MISKITFLKANSALFIFISIILFSCESEYSRHKIQNEPVFDENYYKASLQAIDESIKRNPESADGYYKKAVVLSRLKNNKEAENAIEIAIELENNAEYYFLATQLYLENNKPEKGLISAMNAEKAGMNNGWVFSIIANIILQNGDSIQAFKYMDKAIASDPSNAMNYINRGKLMLSIKDTSNALASFHSSLNLDSSNVDVLDLLTDVYLTQRQYKKAEVLLNKKLKFHPSNPKNHLQAALINWKTGNIDSARYSLSRIIENEPADHLAYKYISLIEFQKKQYDSASWYAEKVLSLKNDEKDAILTIARIKDLKKQYYSALVQYDRLIKLDTTHTTAKEERARIQKKINNLAHSKQEDTRQNIPQIQQRF